jgi:hypothetical protein
VNLVLDETRPRERVVAHGAIPATYRQENLDEVDGTRYRDRREDFAVFRARDF